MAQLPARWTRQHVRHAAEMVKQGWNPAARFYESIGPDFFLALAPGWLNLGLWEGAGSEDEAEEACRRLIMTLASAVPAGGVVVDVGNGLGTQDPLIARALHPRRLITVNITEWQLTAGRDRLREAAAAPVVGDAVRLPIADNAADAIISVEAAFHFRTRKAFFEECYRVLRPGGVLSISDISVQRWPVTPAEVVSGLTQLRVFGLRRSMAMTTTQIAAAVSAAGLAEVEVTPCGDRVIGPALRLTAARLAGTRAAPVGHRAAARLLIRQMDLLWRRRIIDYLMLRAVRPLVKASGGIRLTSALQPRAGETARVPGPRTVPGGPARPLHARTPARRVDRSGASRGLAGPSSPRQSGPGQAVTTG
jgi:SAM-dependent methyltransferase